MVPASIPLYKRWLSYLMPITIEQRLDHRGDVLCLQRYRGQWMLISPKAMYSFGTSYRPFIRCFRQIHNELPHVHQFLLLGTGLGSALAILQQRYHCYPATVLVDNDADVLHLGQTYMALDTRRPLTWVWQDAYAFLQKDEGRYDLIAVDVFHELQVPAFLFNAAFLEACALHLNENGICLINTILAGEDARRQFRKMLLRFFTRVDSIQDDVNTYFIARL